MKFVLQQKDKKPGDPCTKWSYLEVEQIWMRQLPERMLKFQDNRKSQPPDINFQYIPPPPVFPPSGIQTNLTRKRKLRRDQKEKREAEEHLRRARRGLGHAWELTGECFAELLSFPQGFASRIRQPVTVASLGKACHGQHPCLGCPQVLLSSNRRVQVPSGTGTSWPMNFMITYPKGISCASFKDYLRGPWRTFLWTKIDETYCMYRNARPSMGTRENMNKDG